MKLNYIVFLPSHFSDMLPEMKNNYIQLFENYIKISYGIRF